VNAQQKPSKPPWPPIEAALRYLAVRDHGMLVDLLKHAIDRPQSKTGKALAPLTEPTAVLDDWTSHERAYATWQLIKEGVGDPDVSPTPLSRRRRALHAALRLPDAAIPEWGSSLTERFKQLKILKNVFGKPTTTQPMEIAWKRGVASLAEYLEQQFQELLAPDDWEPYRPSVPDLEYAEPDKFQSYFDVLERSDAILRRPSKGAQPIFVDLFVTNVFMKGRIVHRRITERLITAREDGVEYYTARGFTAVRRSRERNYVPVRALWGCSEELVPATRPGEPTVTRLWFPKPLQNGQRAYFASETRFDLEDGASRERRWVDVDVDHHGIARGQLLYGDRLPVRGLTIRIRFDLSQLPEVVWWYAEQTERERYNKPPDDDEHFLTLIGNEVQKTFTEQPCQPRESYGIAFSWPTE